MLKKIRPMIVVATLVVSLAFIFGTQFAVKTYRLEEPFKQEVLSLQGVKDVQLVNTSDGRAIRLTLGQDVQLKDMYQHVEKLAKETWGENFTIEMKDTASAEMAEIYQEMHFAVYEGIASGKFTQMAAQMKEIANAVEVSDYELQVDNTNVYLKLVKDGEVFTQVIPRQAERVAYITTEGGESQW